MEISILTIDRGPLPLLYAALILLGGIGYFVARRWPRALVLLVALWLWLTWEAVALLAGFLVAGWEHALVRYVLWQGALGLVPMVLGLGLPLAGARRRRSRPAI